MSIRAHGLKALGLSFLAVVSLTAIGAAGARATAGKFLVNKSTSLNAKATGEIDLTNVLVVPAIQLEIECTSFKVVNGELTAAAGHGLAELLYQGCKAYTYEIIVLENEIHIISEWETDCEIYESALDRTKLTNKGSILVKALLLVLLHSSGETIIKAEPKEGTTVFSKIFFRNCLISSVDISGAVDLSLHQGGDRLDHLIEEASVGLSQLKYGGSNAFLEGSVWVSLASAHEGMHWGII